MVILALVMADCFHFSDISEASLNAIQVCQRQFLNKTKGRTIAGKERLQRIIQKLFYENAKLKILLDIYPAILQHFKQYVMVFQQEGSWVHLIHHRMMEAVKRFLVCFVKAQYVTDDPEKLVRLDLTKAKYQLPLRDLYYGAAKNRILSGLEDKNGVVENIASTIQGAFVECGLYMLNKLPLNNDTILGLACLDPELTRHSTVTSKLTQLANTLLPFLPSETILSDVEMEIRLYVVDSDTAKIRYNSPVEFWNSDYIGSKYPLLKKVANLGLSIFHGPSIEGNFSRMSSIITKQRNSLGIQRVSALQTCKYFLRNKKKTAISLCERRDKYYGRIQHPFCSALMGAAKRYKIKQQNRLNEQARRRRRLGLKKIGTASAALALRKEKDRKRAKAYRQKALAKLAAARRAKAAARSSTS